MKFARLGAVFYLFWGLLHMVGGAVMLTAANQGAEQGYQVFLHNAGSYNALSGAVLSYHSFNLVWLGFLVSLLAVLSNWNNRRYGAWMNFALVGFADAGLVWFMLIPGFLKWSEGTTGLVLFGLAALFTVLGRRAQVS